MQVQLAQQILDVDLHRAVTDAQLAGNQLVAEAAPDPFEGIAFTLGQAFVPFRCRGPVRCLGPVSCRGPVRCRGSVESGGPVERGASRGIRHSWQRLSLLLLLFMLLFMCLCLRVLFALAVVLLQTPGEQQQGLFLQPQLAVDHGLQALENAFGVGVLHQVAIRPLLDGIQQVAAVIGGGQQHYLESGITLLEMAHQGQAIELRHLPVDDHQLRGQGGQGVEQIGAVIEVGHDLEQATFTQKLSQPTPKQRMVVDEHDSCRGCRGCLVCRGHLASHGHVSWRSQLSVTRVPPWRGWVMAKSAPSWRARSCMMPSPKWAGATSAGSKPQPLSSMVSNTRSAG